MDIPLDYVDRVDEQKQLEKLGKLAIVDSARQIEREKKRAESR